MLQQDEARIRSILTQKQVNIINVNKKNDWLVIITSVLAH
jgi:hypothetical protein